ncbi:MAG: diguanylate cyclase [Deltaproteobacteria bacterium]|nr:diguanylate cyclase [Deltaproteobacteria bacterium]
MSEEKKNRTYGGSCLPVAIVMALIMACLTLIALPVLAGEEAPTPRPEAPKRVLILNSHDYGMPWQQSLNQSIRRVFVSDTSIETKLYTEYTGLSQTLDDVHVQNLIDLYRHKYADKEIDLIIAIDAAFLSEHGEDLFPGVPIVFISGAEYIKGTKVRPNMTGLLLGIDVRGTLDVALKLHPDCRRIVVISGTSEMDRSLYARARRVFQDYAKRLQFIYLKGFSMAEILAEVSQLPEHTIVFYLLTLVDGAGEAFIPKDAVAHISQASNAPVYGLLDSLLGNGLVGGSLSHTEEEGARVARMGLRILGGEKPENIPMAQGSYTYMFDWRQLKRWGISENDLPPGSIVRYKEISFWEQYKWRIVGVVVLLVLETLLIFILLIQRSRLRRTDIALRKSRDQLEMQVEERTIELGQANQELVESNQKLDKANERLTYLSYVDEVTEINNRRYLDESLDREWKRATRNSLPLSLIMMDIDFFKKYNDIYGHLKGDECLKKIAGALSQALNRPADFIARYGGEEFVAVLPGTNIEGATHVADYLRKIVEEMSIEHDDAVTRKTVTISLGVASTIPKQHDSWDRLLKEADKALYRAKEEGRNRVVSAPQLGMRNVLT